jgi:RNA polymerase sigma-70 factor (ECF subfamily)
VTVDVMTGTDLGVQPEVHGDLVLAERCLAGDAGAFETMYRTNAPRLYGLACRLVSREEADDLLQDIFLTAHRKLGSYKGGASLGTWLYRLATNLCVDYLRSRGARFAQQTDPLDADDRLAGSAPATGPILGVLDRMALDRAIAELPPGCRQVFVLHDVEGLEHQEIAATLDISMGTSKSQLHKARRRLRVLLTQGPGA